MTKSKIITNDYLLTKIRAILRSIEPRQMPTETITNEYGHKGWKCPYCGGFCKRRDRYKYNRYGRQEIVDYSSYNLHFSNKHATPFWKEKQILTLIGKSK